MTYLCSAEDIPM